MAAPFAISGLDSLHQGADLSYIICCRDAANSIKSYSPETIVLPLLRTEDEVRREFQMNIKSPIGQSQYNLIFDDIISNISKWLKVFDVLVVGPGLGRDDLVQKCALRSLELARELNIPIVIDGDGLAAIQINLESIQNYHRVILTPNVVEYGRLCQHVLGFKPATRETDNSPSARTSDLQFDSISSSNQDLSKIQEIPGGGYKSNFLPLPDSDLAVVNSQSPDHRILKHLARVLGNVTIVKKGAQDLITDGKLLIQSNRLGSYRRCGGQGDILAGITATFLAWNYSNISTYHLVENMKNKDGHQKIATRTLLAVWGAANLSRECAHRSFLEHHRGTTSSHILSHVGPSFFDLCEHQSEAIIDTQDSYFDQ